MATMNQLDSDFLLPPRKRLLAGFKKQNSNGSSSSSTSYSNGSSSASTVVHTHLDNLLTSQLNDGQSRSPEELKATAALAVKIAKAARAAADEKAIIASKAVAAAKSALELFASFPAETDLARRLNRAINSSPRVLTGHRNKKLKSVATYENSGVYDGHDVAGVVDSDTSTDDEVNRTRVNGKKKTGEESSSLGKRRGRVKLKKLPLRMCASKDQENGIITNSLSQTGGSNGGVGQVRS
ncbi:BnaA06g25790D [Brassica napus]|uniref:BnaA06g25790D protein n=1 Tax=Brassica napus TaxID=3708 RepID=A0A078GX41_BRANA|nr:BnaA06g25790D [Brassica napus]